jgi:muramoyltetrapeptide carboxypeptidase
LQPLANSAKIPFWPKAGQTLAVAAPAGAVQQFNLDAGLAVLAELAPQAPIRVDQVVLQKEGYLAGADVDRAAHLAELMTAPDLGAVLCARGGFGTSRLLPLLNLGLLVDSRRLVMGYSDFTALLNALAARGLVALHGPMVTQLPHLDPTSRQALADLLAGRLEWPLELHGQSVTSGRVSGCLWGGNLTMLCHLLGTPWLPPLEGGLLILEEVNEPSYRLDRLLTQLELAGVFDQVAGVALGSLSQEEGAQPALRRVAEERLSGLKLPVVMGLPFGHGNQNLPIPIGAQAELDADAGRLIVGLNLA